MDNQEPKLTPTTNLKCFPNKQGFISELTYFEVCKILGFKDNYSDWEDESKISHSWLFEDEKGNQYSVWKYISKSTYSVYGNKDLLNTIFKNKITWIK